MRSVTAYISAYKGKKKANFCVLLQGEQEDLEVVYGIKDDYTANLLALTAAQFATEAIKTNEVNFNLKTSNRYVESMLEKKDGKWVKNAKSNKTIIEATRAKLDTFESFSVALDSSDTMLRAKSEAKSN